MFTVLLVTYLLKYSSSEYCECVPFWKCDDTSDEMFDMMGPKNGCPGYFDECCRVKCGQRKSDILPVADMARILGKADEAKFAEFPWMLGVLYENAYKCGGSLIHPTMALTVAHCVHSAGTYKVRAGEWDWEHRDEPLKHQDRLAKKIIIHPKYNPRSLINDIALVLLERPFRLSEHIGVVCLPRQRTASSTECVVSGWGKISFKSQKQYEPILKYANLPLVDSRACVQSLQKAHFGPSFQLHQSFICAGGGSKDSCKGDGGSPLVCQTDENGDRYEQLGIVSWGLVCGTTNCPGVYVNVALFVQWIDKEMMRHNLDPDIYKLKELPIHMLR